VEKSTQPFFIFLENDWMLLEDPKEAIAQGITYLDSNTTDVVRYRHRKYPGEPLWTYQFKDHEYDRPTHLLDAVHWTLDPEKFAEIEKISDDPWYRANAKYANWTNNPTMFRTDFLKKWILPNIGTRDAEVDLQPWWEQQDFLVMQGHGLFAHRRVG